MFTEVFWRLLEKDGRLGVILPTGIYSDYGTKDLREEPCSPRTNRFALCLPEREESLRRRPSRYKQTALLATGRSYGVFRARFRMGVGDSPEAHEIPFDLLRATRGDGLHTRRRPQNSPKSLSVVELRCHRDLVTFRKIYDHSTRIGDNDSGWEITYATEFHMSNDSKLFPPLESWEAMGYKPDVFGRWIGPERGVALPLFQGAMIHHFSPASSTIESGGGLPNRKALVTDRNS